MTKLSLEEFKKGLTILIGKRSEDEKRIHDLEMQQCKHANLMVVREGEDGIFFHCDKLDEEIYELKEKNADLQNRLECWVKTAKKFADKKKEWQVCPVCKGQGMVERPAGVMGTAGQWVSSTIAYPCQLCGGKKVINRATGGPE